MSSTQKLTKKQKKGLAFRERKTGKRPLPQQSHHKDKGQGQDELDDMEANAIPTMEDQDLIGDDGGAPQVAGNEDKKAGKPRGDKERNAQGRKEGKEGRKGKGKAAEPEDVRESEPVSVKKSGKRKREGGAEEEKEKEDETKKATKRKKVSEEEKSDKSKQRFILFVGNLKYSTSKEAIQKHFESCDPPPTIRLLTPKVTPGVPQKAKSKGCAFLEFTHRNALQQGLKLHQSNLEGRMINVELTAGGGGKSETRLTKVRERNKALLGQRVERIEKEAEKDGSFPNLPGKPQRFSMTSGLEQKPVANKTWTVGDVEDGETHRGGERHRKKSSKANFKAWGTGVNAIPVG